MAKRTASWIPQQHGAWAMIVVPYLTGLALAAQVRPLGLGDLLLGITWLVGYFAFNDLVLIVKSPPRRRAQHYPALAVYGLVSCASGVATLLLTGAALLLWTPLYAVLLGTSLYLAATKRERALLSGVLTILASCGLMGVLRIAPGLPAPSPHEIALMVLITAYFIGTVPHVKALIRERNNPAAARRSLGYHLVLALAVCVAIGLGWLHWAWAVWALALVGRSWVLPRARRTPAQIGAVELTASGIALLLVAL